MIVSLVTFSHLGEKKTSTVNTKLLHSTPWFQLHTVLFFWWNVILASAKKYYLQLPLALEGCLLCLYIYLCCTQGVFPHDICSYFVLYQGKSADFLAAYGFVSSLYLSLTFSFSFHVTLNSFCVLLTHSSSFATEVQPSVSYYPDPDAQSKQFLTEHNSPRLLQPKYEMFYYLSSK